MDVRTFALRCRWHLRALGRNPLIRATDRLEALFFIAILTMIVLAIPVAARIDVRAYDSGLRAVNAQVHNRHSVQAVVLEGSSGLPTDFDTPLYVPVQWREGNRLRTESVVSPETVEAGAPLTVWLDPAGNVVGAPLTPTDAEMTAVGVAGTVWALVAVLGGLAALAIRSGLDRFRAHAWERAVQLLAHNDDGWANRRM